MTEAAAALHDLISRRAAVVGVLGLGYVGLPLARAFSRRGFRVLGFDTDAGRVAALARAESDVLPFSASDLGAMRQAGFEATDNTRRLPEADALLICVPTPLASEGQPDLSFVRAAATLGADHLRRGQLVVLESTSYPGTTRQVVLPILKSSGLEIGVEAFLAYSPEREDPGRSGHSVADVPKVVGGLSREDLHLACALYDGVAGGVVQVGSLEIAEASKILENTYRAVNIALINELKVVFDRMGIDIWEVIEAAATKPFGFQAFYPGPGLGGPCLPVNPAYLAWASRAHGLTARLVEMAGSVNDQIPAYVAAKIADALSIRGKALAKSRILLIGLAYKRDVADPRGSPGINLLELLVSTGAEVEYNDPHVPALTNLRHHSGRGLASQPLTAERLAALDCAVIVTDHSVYDWEWIVARAPLIVDTRNATRSLLGRFRERIVLA